MGSAYHLGLWESGGPACREKGGVTIDPWEYLGQWRRAKGDANGNRNGMHLLAF